MRVEIIWWAARIIDCHSSNKLDRSTNDSVSFVEQAQLFDEQKAILTQNGPRFLLHVCWSYLLIFPDLFHLSNIFRLEVLASIWQWLGIPSTGFLGSELVIPDITPQLGVISAIFSICSEELQF